MSSQQKSNGGIRMIGNVLRKLMDSEEEVSAAEEMWVRLILIGLALSFLLLLGDAK